MGIRLGAITASGRLIDDLTAAAVRRVRTPAGAKRYKQPIGSIIIARPGKKALSLSAMGDSDLTELMGDAAAQDKNPDVYEAAFTEWARRQPDREEPGPDIDDRVGPPEDLDSVQLDLVRAELDTATADLKARIDSGGPDVDAAIARVEVAEGLLRHEQKMAAARAGTNDGARPETATSTAGDAPAVEATPERAQAWNTVRDTETKAEQDGTGFEEALGRSPEETAAAIAERDAVRDGYTSAADKARDAQSSTPDAPPQAAQNVSADPAPATEPPNDPESYGALSSKAEFYLRQRDMLREGASDPDRPEDNRRELAESADEMDETLRLLHGGSQLPVGGELLHLRPQPFRDGHLASEEESSRFVDEYQRLVRAGDLDGAYELTNNPPHGDGTKLYDARVAQEVSKAIKAQKASTGLPAMSDNDIIRKAESLAARKRFGQDVQQEIAALKSEAARRNPGLDMAVGGILAVDVRQAREQGVRSSRQRTRSRRR